MSRKMNGLFRVETVSGMRYEVEEITISSNGECYFRVRVPYAGTTTISIHDCKPIAIGVRE